MKLRKDRHFLRTSDFRLKQGLSTKHWFIAMPDARTSVSELLCCFRVEFSSNPKDTALIWDYDLGWRFWGRFLNRWSWPWEYWVLRGWDVALSRNSNEKRSAVRFIPNDLRQMEIARRLFSPSWLRNGAKASKSLKKSFFYGGPWPEDHRKSGIRRCSPYVACSGDGRKSNCWSPSWILQLMFVVESDRSSIFSPGGGTGSVGARGGKATEPFAVRRFPGNQNLPLSTQSSSAPIHQSWDRYDNSGSVTT